MDHGFSDLRREKTEIFEGNVNPCDGVEGEAAKVREMCREIAARITWAICRLCYAEATVDEFGDCGLCRTRRKAKALRLQRWARNRKLKGQERGIIE